MLERDRLATTKVEVSAETSTELTPNLDDLDLAELMRLYEALNDEGQTVLSIDEEVIQEVTTTNSADLDQVAAATEARFTSRASDILANIGSIASVISNLQPFFQSCLHCVTGIGAVANASGGLGGSLTTNPWNGLLNANHSPTKNRPTLALDRRISSTSNYSRSRNIPIASSLWEFLNPSQTFGLQSLFQAHHSIGLQHVLLELFAA